MKMQLALRETGEILKKRSVSMVAGFVSAIPGALPAEGIVECEVMVDPNGKVIRLGAMGATYQPDLSQRDPEYLSFGMGNFVTQQIWHIPKVMDALTLYCREVRMPAADPLFGQVYAVEGFMTLKEASLDFDHISVFEGTAHDGLVFKGALGQEVKPDWYIPPMVEATRGNSLAQFFKMPVWGWGEEPVGMISTMHPKVCDAMDEYRWKPQTEWSPGLEDGLRRWGLLWPKDEQFRATTEMIQSSHPGYLERRHSAGVQTRAEEELMASRMKEALSQVLDQEDSPSP